MVINLIVGVYIPIIRIPIKGGMTIPNIATFDHGTYHFYVTILGCSPQKLKECFFLYTKQNKKNSSETMEKKHQQEETHPGFLFKPGEVTVYLSTMNMYLNFLNQKCRFTKLPEFHPKIRDPQLTLDFTYHKVSHMFLDVLFSL